MDDFIIVGAGYAGLSAGALLSRKGYRVTVFEKAKRAGGRSAYHEKDGFVWQYGQHSHRLENHGAAARTLNRLGKPIEFLPVPPKSARLYYRGRLYRRPEGVKDFLTFPGLSFKDRITFLRFYITLLKADPAHWYDATLAEFYDRSFRNSAVREFISFLGMTVMLPDIEAVSAGEVIDFIQRAKKAPVKQGEPRMGAKQVIDKLVAALEEYGGHLRCGETVEAIKVDNGAAVGVRTAEEESLSARVIYAAPLQQLFELVPPGHFSKTFVDYCRFIQYSSGVVIDFVSREPLADFPGGILGVDLPLWVKFQTLIDPSVAPPGFHVCTWGMLNQDRGEVRSFEETEARLREIAAACMPGYQEKVAFERKIAIPVLNANMLIPRQSRPHRPDVVSHDVKNLYFAGDTVAGEGCSGDIAFSSAMKLADSWGDKSFHS